MSAYVYSKYPNLSQVLTADRQTICGWYRHLPSPEGGEQQAIMQAVYERFHAMGGMTPAISKAIGLGGSRG